MHRQSLVKDSYNFHPISPPPIALRQVCPWLSFPPVPLVPSPQRQTGIPWARVLGHSGRGLPVDRNTMGKGTWSLGTRTPGASYPPVLLYPAAHLWGCGEILLSSPQECRNVGRYTRTVVLESGEYPRLQGRRSCTEVFIKTR